MKLKIDPVLKNFPHIRFSDIGNFMKGPRGSRVITPAAYAQLGSSDARDAALKLLGASATLTTGEQVKVKAAISKVNSHRNWALRKAEELVKASNSAAGKRVELSFKERVVKVDNAVAFEQSPEDLGGTFKGAFSSLRLP